MVLNWSLYPRSCLVYKYAFHLLFSDRENFFISVVYFLCMMDCFLCEKMADPNTLPRGVRVQWRLIWLAFTISFYDFVLKFVMKHNRNYVCYLCEQHTLEHQLYLSWSKEESWMQTKVASWMYTRSCQDCSACLEIRWIGSVCHLMMKTTAQLMCFFVPSQLDCRNSLLIDSKCDEMCRLQKVENHAEKVVFHKSWHEHIRTLLKALHWLPVKKNCSK